MNKVAAYLLSICFAFKSIVFCVIDRLRLLHKIIFSFVCFFFKLHYHIYVQVFIFLEWHHLIAKYTVEGTWPSSFIYDWKRWFQYWMNRGFAIGVGLIETVLCVMFCGQAFKKNKSEQPKHEVLKSSMYSLYPICVPIHSNLYREDGSYWPQYVLM